VGSNLKLVHGLVGKRGGIGFMRERVFNAMNRLDDTGRAVPYVDLSELVDGWNRIDLVKCDIEGSEGEFVRSYPDVLAKTRSAVFEFHEVEGHVVAECRELLLTYGLIHSKRLRAFAKNTVELFWR
jgi:hypothetical protein